MSQALLHLLTTLNAAYLNLLFGFLLFFGGLMGYVKKKSVISFVMGSVLACGYWVAGCGLMDGPNFLRGNLNLSDKEYFLIAASTSLILVGAMLPRFLSSMKFMPAGMCSVIGVLGLLINGLRAKELM